MFFKSMSVDLPPASSFLTPSWPEFLLSSCNPSSEELSPSFVSLSHGSTRIYGIVNLFYGSRQISPLIKFFDSSERF